MESFLYPGNGVIAASGKYDVFAPNVKGRVDITTDFNGAGEYNRRSFRLRATADYPELNGMTSYWRMIGSC
jgi:hypothetical protein